MALGPEDRLTGWLRRRVARRGLDLVGDDAAFVDNDRLAITVDQQIEGVHFQPALPAAELGRRLVAVNLSDVAAVGGEPILGFAALAAPPGYPLRPVLAAIEETLAAVGARLAGGDIARSDTLHASLTLVARRRLRCRWVRRTGARADDVLWAGGTLGESALGRRVLSAGARLKSGRVRLPQDLARTRRVARCARAAALRHVRPPEQLHLGAWLSRRRRAAAIDVSDGLALDLERLCRANGVGAVVEVERLPLAAGAEELARELGVDARQLAISGGEDYVLLFALPRTIVPPEHFGAHRLGRFRSSPRVEIRGLPKPVRPGWDHLDG